MKWKDCPLIYPPSDEIALALQDVGKSEKATRKGREVQLHKFPLIEKLARKIYNAIQKEFKNPVGLTKNVTRGSKGLYQELVMLRKHVDAVETDPFFHKYSKDGKVFLIANAAVHSGINIAIGHFQEAIENNLQQKNTARTSSDGLRIGCILLDPQYRDTVSGIMTKKKSRTQSDVTGDPTTHFFEMVLNDCFLNPSYIVSPPVAEYYNQFPEDEKPNWDPNAASIFEHGNTRTPEWMREMWESYLRPKYKKALDKWNKDTGGGDGSPVNFINFCAGDRWLVYLFCKDIETNFLLAGNAGGRMPRHLQMESGFSDQSSLTGSENSQNVLKKRIASGEDELLNAKKARSEILETLSLVRSAMQKKQSPTRGECLNQVASYSQMMVDENVLDTMSPGSKQVYVESLKRERKDLLQKLGGKRDGDRNDESN
jgi:hypothetical protein